MGIISDYLEFNKERSGQLFSSWNRAEGTQLPFPKFSCPVCATLLPDETDLQLHILAKHRYIQLYLKLNGTVLPDVAYVENEIVDLRVTLLGDVSGIAQVRIDDSLITQVSLAPGHTANLTKAIPKSVVGQIEIGIAVGTRTRAFTIYSRTQPPINTSAINLAIISLQAPLLAGKEPDWTRFQREVLQKESSFLEKRYAEGFYSYLLGCYLESIGDSRAGKHLEEALGLIRPFGTPLARTARFILAIKLNAFQLLEDCGAESCFYPARTFFLGGHYKPKTASRFETEIDLWADSFLEDMLIAFRFFIARDFVELDTAIDRLRVASQCGDTNNYEKVTLLRARSAKEQGRKADARRAYAELKGNPVFGKEAEEFCG